MATLTASEPQLQQTASKVPAWKWGVVWALFLATTLNYMDRQTMASTAKYIMTEFHLKEEGYGKIEFYFSITFAFVQLAAGALADRVNLLWLYAAALVVWSGAGFMTGMVETIGMLYFCRVMLGVGESFNWVCAGGVIQRIIPRESRSLANAIFHGGSSVGAALTPLLAIWIVGPNGENWRTLFQVVGAAGIIWLVMWFALLRGERSKEISATQSTVILDTSDALAGTRPADISFWTVMTYRTFWITMAVGIAINVVWHFARAWLSRILDTEMHFDHTKMQYSLAIFFVASDLGGILVGWITRKMITRGMPAERVRVYVLFGLAFLCMLFGPALALKSHPILFMFLVSLVGVGAMGSYSVYFTLSQEISGPHTSRCLGVLGFVVWVILAFMQWAVGAIKDQIGSFEPILWVIGFVPVFGAASLLFWPKTHEGQKT